MTEPPDKPVEPGPDIEVDCRGRPCPAPVIELAKAFAMVPVGGAVAVVSDDPAAATDVPAWCRLRGQEYLGHVPSRDGVPRYRVRRLT